MTDDAVVRAILDRASALALRDPDAALRLLAEAVELARSSASPRVAEGFEVVGRIAAAAGELERARQGFEMAVREAIAARDALVLARARSALVTLTRAHPYESSAAAFATELRFAADLLDAAHVSLDPAPHLHGARTRLDLRRRFLLEGRRAVPAIGRCEIALGLSPIDMAVLAICAALSLEPGIERLVPPATLHAQATWTEIVAAWLAPVDPAATDVDAVLERLVRHALVQRRGDGRPELAPDVESLLNGRALPALAAGFAPATGTPIWQEGPATSPAPGPAALPRVLAIVGESARCIDHATQLAAARRWPLWIARGQPQCLESCVRSTRALVREALVHDRVLAIATHALEPTVATAAIAEAAARVDHLVVLGASPPAIADHVLYADPR